MKRILFRLSRGKSAYQISLFERIILWLIYFQPLKWVLKQRDYTSLRRLDKCDTILVISDVNIGDSIMLQSAVEALRYYFPNAEIDYMYNSVVQDLLGLNPAISSSYPLFTSNTNLEDQNNALEIRNVLKRKQYNLILNVYPMIGRSELKSTKCQSLLPLNIVLDILNAHKRNDIASLPFRLTCYINDLVAHLPAHLRPDKEPFVYRENSVHIDSAIFQKREQFLQRNRIDEDAALVFINPDTSNIYTFIEPQLYIDLIHLLLESDKVDYVILGWSFQFEGTSNEIYDNIQTYYQNRVVMMPNDSALSFYAAIVDRCDCFISGDTGPLHIAASRKIAYGSKDCFANTTSIVNIFRATEPKIYGYDTYAENVIDSGQDAPARMININVACKRLSCTIQRIIKTCDAARCGGNITLDAQHISNFVCSTMKTCAV